MSDHTPLGSPCVVRHRAQLHNGYERRVPLQLQHIQETVACHRTAVPAPPIAAANANLPIATSSVIASSAGAGVQFPSR